MVNLTTATSRSIGRIESYGAFRNINVSSDLWQGLSVTTGPFDFNGQRWGFVGCPTPFIREFSATSGGADTFGVNSVLVTDFGIHDPSIFPGMRCRVFRVVDGVLTLARTSDIASVSIDYWNYLSGSKPLTQTTYEHVLDSVARLKVYTYGVAVIDMATGLIGPVSTVAADVTGSPRVTLPRPDFETTSTDRAVNGRDGALPAITGLTANIREDTTHNVQLSWDAAATGTYVVMLNYDGTSDLLREEGTITLETGGVPIRATDMIIIDAPARLTYTAAESGARLAGAARDASYSNPIGAISTNSTNDPSGQTWQYVAFDGGFPKPDITYPEHFLQIDSPPGIAPVLGIAFHSGNRQAFYDVLIPGRTYRAEFVIAASEATDVTFAVQEATISGPNTETLTTSLQTIAFDFSFASILTTASPRAWSLTAATTGVSLKVASIRIWDISKEHGDNVLGLPTNVDVRDHAMIKTRPISFDGMTSRNGSTNARGWTLECLFRNCLEAESYPHLQIEWSYDDQYYLDLVTFLCAPASSGEPLALKREAMGFGPIHEIFDRWSYEDGNERWNRLMRIMFRDTTDAVTDEVYSQGDIAAMFAARRRAIMESSPYWPTTNQPVEWAGGWARNVAFTVSAANYPACDLTSIAAYNQGWESGQTILEDNATVWDSILTYAEREARPGAVQLLADIATAGFSAGVGIYEAGPGYQLNGLNGSTLSKFDEIQQECMQKSRGSCTALMASVAMYAELGVGPYNFFTWGGGAFWKAGRIDSENEGHGSSYNICGGFLKEMHETLGKCRVFGSRTFIERDRIINILSEEGTGEVVAQAVVPLASVYQFESLDYPGRVGILYCNMNLNREAFGVGHPDYVEGDTGEVIFKYHTRLPATATPFKVLRNEGNVRQHDAYKVGFRPEVVDSAVTGYIADPLCVDLTVTPEDFTVDNVQIRELTLLGGNCRLEVFET